MKKLLFLLPLLVIIGCSDADNPHDAIINNRGCVECDEYAVGQSFIIGGVRYEVADRAMLEAAIADGLDLTKFCTSRIVHMDGLFAQNQSFNQDIGSWDVSNVTDMSFMFSEAESFNQDIGNWDVSSVTDMHYMFHYADLFNQDISSWDVSNVTDMSFMFRNDRNFNQDIGNWDVANVTDMNFMFSHSTSFNQDLTHWCVSKIFLVPQDFSNYSALTASNHPVWGTCP